MSEFVRAVYGVRTLVGDVGASRIEVCVVRHDVALFNEDTVDDVLSAAALVRGDDVLEAHHVADGVAEFRETPTPGVGFVTAHKRSPLIGAHRSGPGVSEKVDEYVLSIEVERVVSCRVECRLTFLA